MVPCTRLACDRPVESDGQRGAKGVREAREIALFCLLAFGLSWAIWIPMALHGVMVRAGSLPSHMLGLLGPMGAAWLTGWLVSGGAAVRRDWWRRICRLPQGVWGWTLALSPAAMIVALLITQRWIDLGLDPVGMTRFSGLPVLPVPLLFMVVVLVNGFGEEAGWRGFLLPRLQRRLGPVRGILVQAMLWIAWHAPLFWIVATYRAMPVPMILFGFGLGLVLGGFVLAQVAAVSRGSVPAVALWHSFYNFGTATELGGSAAALLSAAAMVWGGGLLLWALISTQGARAIRVPPPSTKPPPPPR